MKRIMIIGFSGSGKSTLAAILAERLGTEAIHLDSIHWLPNWVENTPENEAEILKPLLDAECWVTDGNYSKVLYNERTELADTIIFLDFNRFLCLYRAIKRYFKNRGKTRKDMGEGCPEKLDFEFIKWVLFAKRSPKKHRSIIDGLETLRRKNPGKSIYILKNPKDVRDFLRTCGI